MSDYCKAYSRVLRYGLAPKESVDEFVHKGALDGQFSANNNSDHILADFLGDHEDPREKIVRRDLSYRQSQGEKGRTDFWANIGEHRNKLLDSEKDGLDVRMGIVAHRTLPDGDDLGISVYTNRKNGKKVHLLTWEPTAKGISSTYMGHFTPEESADILSKLGVEPLKELTSE